MSTSALDDLKLSLNRLDNGLTLIEPTKDISDIHTLSLLNKELGKLLHHHGAILLRGFDWDSSETFKEMASIFINEDFMSENGEHNTISGINGVYSPVDYSPREKLLWHNENSYNDSWPLIIMFGAMYPAAKGGETPIVDSRQMLLELDPEVVAEFKQKGVMYVRTHGFGLGRSWQDIYKTQSKADMEKHCKDNDIQIEWITQDKLITRQIRPAIITHPITDELSWFTQAQHWHPYCLLPEVRTYLMQLFSDTELPRNCYFGDGSIISDAMMQHILDVYQKLEISFSWKKSDVMVLDNALFAHGRNVYSGERKLLVSMGKKHASPRI